jgi:hypothetical protein
LVASAKAQSSNNKTKSLNTDSVQQIIPPLYGFYSKYLNCDGIAIRSAQVVDDRALYIASAKIKMMLKHMDAARQNLIKNGAELHIIGKDQQTSDLPELADQKNVNYVDKGQVTDIDKRTRGVGGIYASCGEENLLQLPADRYAGGYDICVHEFAHTLMTYGLDESLRQKIRRQCNHAINKGLWKGAYATDNEMEYWAELSMWYFGKHGEFLPGTQLPEAGREGLMHYDADGYKLLDSIYSGLLQPVLKRASVPVMKGAVSGISTERSEIRLNNNRADSVKLYWIDQQGNAKLYAIAPPQKSIVQATFVSHVWMIADGRDKALLYIKVNDPPCNIDLKDTADPDEALLKEASARVSAGNISGQSNKSAELYINNRRADTIKVYWINWNGGKELYETVSPKGSAKLITFFTHLWLIEDGKGKMLGYARVNAATSKLTVGGKGMIIKPVNATPK